MDSSLFSDFWNADLTVTRQEGSRGPDGYSESGTTTLLAGARCDAQGRGRTNQIREEAHEAGDLKAYSIDADVSVVDPGDKATLKYDDGRTFEGHVSGVSPMDSSLTLERD